MTTCVSTNLFFRKSPQTLQTSWPVPNTQARGGRRHTLTQVHLHLVLGAGATGFKQVLFRSVFFLGVCTFLTVRTPRAKEKGTKIFNAAYQALTKSRKF